MRNNNITALEIGHLTKIYPDGDVLAVDDISFSVKKGEIFSFLGPNGAGKTTTISMAAAALNITSGSIKIFDHDVEKETKKVRKLIGICPQDLVFYENLSIFENLIFFGKMYDIPGGKLKSYAEELIEYVGLTEKRNTLASKLSGGMKKRLNLIIGLVNDPEFLFLDEPTAGLDPQTRHLIWDFIKRLKKRGKTILLTTHYMDEADTLSDRVAIIDNGKIIAVDTPFSLKRKHSSGDIIELKFNNPEAELLKKMDDLKANESYKDAYFVEEDNIIRIAIHDGLQNIGLLIQFLKDLDLDIIDINVRSNSLENVFISLTGKTLRE